MSPFGRWHHYAKDKESLEKTQRRFTQIFKELKGKDYTITD